MNHSCACTFRLVFPFPSYFGYGLILSYTVNMCHSDWFNKNAKRPIGRQDFWSRDYTEKKGGVKRHSLLDTEEAEKPPKQYRAKVRNPGGRK